MDIDSVPQEIAFSSEAKGKKMSKANLPVSAGDTLPWSVERSFITNRVKY